jgi:hypothetical protein
MVPAIIAGAVGLGKAIFGGIKAAKQRRKMDTYLNEQEAENKSWYNANALSDYTQRADTQALMKQLRDTLGRQNKKAAGAAVVTGATVEEQAVQKELSNKVISDTFSNIGAMGQRWKDNITDRYLARKQSLAGQRMGIAAQKAASYESMMSSGLNSLGGALGGIVGGATGGAGTAGTLPSETEWSPLG